MRRDFISLYTVTLLVGTWGVAAAGDNTRCFATAGDDKNGEKFKSNMLVQIYRLQRIYHHGYRTKRYV